MTKNNSWQYKQSTGELYHRGRLFAKGYSGHGDGLNNREMESVVNVGPCPCGQYKLGLARDSKNTGPLTIPLEPVGHNACGRTLLRIHGDDATPEPNSASHGCIILARWVRVIIAHDVLDGDTDFEVMP